jgi:hypothetical protein
MTPEEYNLWWHNRVNTLEGIEYLNEWFMPEYLESYIRERSYTKSDWDDPSDWINGMSLALAFQFREYLPDINAEAKFRMTLAMFLIDLIRRIEWHEE